MDGIGRTIKNKVYRDVMSNKCLIKNAKDFAEYANKTINAITSIYMPINELLTEPHNIENALKIPDTLLKWHEVSMKIFVLLISFVWLMTMIHFLPSSTGKMTTQSFAVTKIYFYCLTLIRHERFVKLSTLRRKRKKTGCNVSCVNNGFTSVAFRNNLLSVNLFVK